MAKPTSKTAVSNLALSHLKIDAVVNIDPPDADSKAAKCAAKWYDQARRQTLEDHPWKFASTRVELLADATAPTFEYLYRYELPPDFIRVNRIGQNWDDPDLDYEIEGSFILCNVPAPLRLVYIYDLTDPSKFSAKFVTTLSYCQAAFMAYEMTGNASIVDAMFDKYEKALTVGASVQGQNRPTRRIERSRLRAARMSGNISRAWRGTTW